MIDNTTVGIQSDGTIVIRVDAGYDNWAAIRLSAYSARWLANTLLSLAEIADDANPDMEEEDT